MAEQMPQGKKSRNRGTTIDRNILAKGTSTDYGKEQMPQGNKSGKRPPRGTVVDRNILTKGVSTANDKDRKPLQFVDEEGKRVSSEDKAPDKVKFPRNSIMKQIFLIDDDADDDAEEVSSSPVPSSSQEPTKKLLKPFNRGSFVVKKHLLTRDEDDRYQNTNDRSDQEHFLKSYGLSKVMRDRVLSVCESTYHLTALWDNGPLMGRDDSMYITGEKKGNPWMNVKPEERLLHNADEYDLKTGSCDRFEAVQDVAYFFTFLAATMGVPATFEVFKKSKKNGGIGKGIRRVGLAPDAKNKGNAEEFLSIEDQVESALEMVEDFCHMIEPLSSSDLLPFLEEVKKHCNDNLQHIEKDDKKVLVVILTSGYPWGKFSITEGVDALNALEDLPVTIVYLAESRDEKVLKAYDDLLSPKGGIKADVKVAKGLGVMVDGIKKHNRWLNFCLPMHLCQTLGIGSNILSQAASRPLRADEVRELCNTFIGDVPDPAQGMEKFLSAISKLMEDEEHIKWNPATGKHDPIIDPAKLKRHLSSKLAPLLVAVLVCVLAIIAGHFSGHLSFASSYA